MSVKEEKREEESCSWDTVYIIYRLVQKKRRELFSEKSSDTQRIKCKN